MNTEELNNLFSLAALNLSKERLHFHTIQFLSKTTAGDYLPLGSGILVMIEESYFIFTAAHVTEDAQVNKQYVNTIVGVQVVVGNCYETTLEDDEAIDLAFIKLDNQLAILLSETYQFLPLTKIGHSHVGKETANYIVGGYPEKNKWKEDEHLITGSSHYQLTMAKDKVYAYYKLNKEVSYALYFSGRGIEIETGAKSEKIPDQYGISGGGIWYLMPYMDKAGKVQMHYCLIGIVTNFKKGKYHVFIGNKVDLIMSGIQDKGLFTFDWHNELRQPEK